MKNILPLLVPRSLISKAVGASALLCLAVPSHAAVLWTFESSTIPSSGFTSWQSDNAQSSANVQSATISLGGGLKNFATSPTAANRWRVDGFFQVGGGVPATLANAVTHNDYFTFTLAPASGFTLDVTSISFTLTTQAATAPTTFLFSLGSSPSTSLITDVNGSSATTVVHNSTTTAVTYNVTLAGLTGITAATEIRLYGYGGQASDRYANIAASDFLINGTVAAVPEPGTPILCAAAGIFFLFARRTRKG